MSTAFLKSLKKKRKNSMDKLYTLKRIKALIVLALKKEKANYSEFILSADTSDSISSLEGMSIKEFIINHDKLQRTNEIYKIEDTASSSKKQEFVIMTEKTMMPFTLTTSVAKPDFSDGKNKALLGKYTKYKALTKASILDVVYQANKENLTRKFLSSNTIEAISEKLKYDESDVLEPFLLYYDVVQSTMLKIKKQDAEKDSTLLNKNGLFTDFDDIRNSDAKSIEKIYEYRKISDLVEKEIAQLDTEQAKDKVAQSGSDLFSVIGKEEFVLKANNLPKNSDILDKFFAKEFDMKAYDTAIYKGTESDYEKHTTLVLERPCQNISEMMLNKQLQNYAKSQRDNVKDFEANQHIGMTA
jgi:hypothetical protein